MTKDSINNLYFCESSWAKLKIIAVTLLEDNEKLVEALEDVSWLDGHGCVTGDCPHYHREKCEKAMTLQLKSSGKHAQEALTEHKDRMKELTGE